MDSTSPDPEAGHAPHVDSSGAPEQPEQPQAHGTDGFFDAIYRLDVERSDERWIGGVAGGVARRLGIDPLLARGVWFAFSLLAGAGLVIYAVAWALLPDARDRRILARDAIHGHFHAAMLGSIAFFVVGLNWRFGHGGWWASTGWILAIFWLCLLAGIGIAVAAVVRADPRTRPVPDATAPDHEAPYAAASEATSKYPDAASYPTAPYPTAPYPTAPYPTTPYPVQGQQATGDTGWTEPPPGRPTKGDAPARKPRPRRGPGSTTTGITLGLCLVAGAVVLGADHSQHDLLRPWLVWGGVCLVILGLGVVAAGIRGRRGGVLTALVLVTGLVVVPLADVNSSSVSSGKVEAIASDEVVHVTDAGVAEDGFAYGVGDLTVDLSDLPLPTEGSGASVHVPIRLGAGNLRIIVPRAADVEASVQLVGGAVTWDVGGEQTSQDGLHVSRTTYRTAGAAAGQVPQLMLDVASAAGNVTIEEQK